MEVYLYIDQKVVLEAVGKKEKGLDKGEDFLPELTHDVCSDGMSHYSKNTSICEDFFYPFPGAKWPMGSDGRPSKSFPLSEAKTVAAQLEEKGWLSEVTVMVRIPFVRIGKEDFRKNIMLGQGVILEYYNLTNSLGKPDYYQFVARATSMKALIDELKKHKIESCFDEVPAKIVSSDQSSLI